MRSASDAAVVAMPEPIGGLGARTLALRPSARRRLRRRLLEPFMHTDALRWRNTTRSIRLFAGAAFSGLKPDGRPRADDHVVSALFCFGAIEESAVLGRLSVFARRRTELGFLRRAYGVGTLRSRQLRRDLRIWAKTYRGRMALREGRRALREWLHGIDPSPRLRTLIESMPGERLAHRERRANTPFRKRAHASRVTARVGS